MIVKRSDISKEIVLEYKDLFFYDTNKNKKFNKTIVLKSFEVAVRNNQSLEIVTEGIIDKIWQNYYSKFTRQQKSTAFLRKFNKSKNTDIFKIIKHLHNVIGIKNIDIIGKEVPSGIEYDHNLEFTNKYIQNIPGKDEIKEIMIDAHFNTLVGNKKFIKLINSVKANRIYRSSAIYPKYCDIEDKDKITRKNKRLENIPIKCLFFPILEIYLTKIKILNIHRDIKPILNALSEFKYLKNKTPYSFGLTDKKLERHFSFSNIFPERDTNLYLVLIFSIYLKIPYESARKFIAVLFANEVRGNFCRPNDLRKRFNDLEDLELMLEYLS